MNRNPKYGLLAKAIRAFFQTESHLCLERAYDLWEDAYRRDKIKRQLEEMVRRGELSRDLGPACYKDGPGLSDVTVRPLGRHRGPRLFDINKAMALRSSGMTFRQIAARLGVSPSAVKAWFSPTRTLNQK